MRQHGIRRESPAPLPPYCRAGNCSARSKDMAKRPMALGMPGEALPFLFPSLFDPSVIGQEYGEQSIIWRGWGMFLQEIKSGQTMTQE